MVASEWGACQSLLRHLYTSAAFLVVISARREILQTLVQPRELNGFHGGLAAWRAGAGRVEPSGNRVRSMTSQSTSADAACHSASHPRRIRLLRIGTRLPSGQSRPGATPRRRRFRLDAPRNCRSAESCRKRMTRRARATARARARARAREPGDRENVFQGSICVVRVFSYPS